MCGDRNTRKSAFDDNYTATIPYPLVYWEEATPGKRSVRDCLNFRGLHSKKSSVKQGWAKAAQKKLAASKEKEEEERAKVK